MDKCLKKTISLEVEASGEWTDVYVVETTKHLFGLLGKEERTQYATCVKGHGLNALLKRLHAVATDVRLTSFPEAKTLTDAAVESLIKQAVQQ